MVGRCPGGVSPRRGDILLLVEVGLGVDEVFYHMGLPCVCGVLGEDVVVLL